ncbi:MAG: alpha-E domain-containing protein [Proteobacteria bacterium]|nr:alpha-E domain-containing protein [Pseudomonadota bacterium]
MNAMYLASLRQSQSRMGRVERRRVLEDLIRDKQSASGMLTDCMSHDVAYQFLRMGEHLERADMTTRILDINAAVLLPPGSRRSRGRRHVAAVGERAEIDVGFPDVSPPWFEPRERRWRGEVPRHRSAFSAGGGVLPR